MRLEQGIRSANFLAATGRYAAPPGPDWGWRIELVGEGPDVLVLRMLNITPDGEEALAVEARLTPRSEPQ
jgi:hypothetical protein